VAQTALWVVRARITVDRWSLIRRVAMIAAALRARARNEGQRAGFGRERLEGNVINHQHAGDDDAGLVVSKGEMSCDVTSACCF
jgi:hypothetical protein